jgi:DNA-binding MarR family transcriptional regulator
MGEQVSVTTHPLDYVLELIDRGYSLEFIAKDAGVQVASIVRRLKRAEKAGLLEKRYSDIVNRWVNR